MGGFIEPKNKEAAVTCRFGKTPVKSTSNRSSHSKKEEEKKGKKRKFCKRMNFRVPLDKVVNVLWKRSSIKDVIEAENDSQFVREI